MTNKIDQPGMNPLIVEATNEMKQCFGDIKLSEEEGYAACATMGNIIMSIVEATELPGFNLVGAQNVDPKPYPENFEQIRQFIAAKNSARIFLQKKLMNTE